MTSRFQPSPPRQTGWLITLLSWLFPILLIFALWSFVFSRIQGGGPAALTIGKSKARIYSEGDTGASFDDVAGIDEAKAELQEIVDFLSHADKYKRFRSQNPQRGFASRAARNWEKLYWPERSQEKLPFPFSASLALNSLNCSLALGRHGFEIYSNKLSSRLPALCLLMSWTP